MNRYLEQLYTMAQNDAKIIGFSNFCKEKHYFVEFDVANCVVEFVIEMLHLYLQKHISVKKRRNFL